jgi:hypothetical protein
MIKALRQVEDEFAENATWKQIDSARYRLEVRFPEWRETFTMEDCLVEARYSWEARLIRAAFEIAKMDI